MADVNNDKVLDMQEFTNFEHPEEAEHMKEIVIKVRRCMFIEENINKQKLILKKSTKISELPIILILFISFDYIITIWHWI